MTTTQFDPHDATEEPSRPARLILVGASGSGKTVVARAVCRACEDWTLIDSDDLIREQFGAERVREIFDAHGEAAFRAAELAIAEGLSTRRTRLVVATGGGMPAVDGAMDRLLEGGVVVFLRASVETSWHRILRDENKRNDLPMLDPDQDGIDSVSEAGRVRLEHLMATREPIYSRAHLTIDTDLLEVDEVVDILRGIIDGLLSQPGG